ncbi:MAG: hypothetical protein BGO16_17015 [Nitrobacter sp. 62-23]|nr:MAG: hypothetical protein BGO16_17015 [Nitrobacter sp. 62-23]
MYFWWTVLAPGQDLAQPRAGFAVPRLASGCLAAISRRCAGVACWTSRTILGVWTPIAARRPTL